MAFFISRMQDYLIFRISSPLGSNVYYINTSPPVIVDTGHPLYAEETVQQLQATIDISKVAYILCTHSHPDHIGAAALLRRQTRAKLCMFARADNEKLTHDHKNELKLSVDYPEPDIVLNDNDCIPLQDDEIHVIHTPGHADDHCCFYFSRRKLLFAGDLLAHDDIGFLNLNKHYTSSLLELERSIKRCASFETKRVYPGHGDRFKHAPWDRCLRKLTFFRKSSTLLIAHTLISPYLFFLWVKKRCTIEESEKYITDHSYLFDGFIENVNSRIILEEFRKLLPLLEIRGVVVREPDIRLAIFSEKLTAAWIKDTFSYKE